MISHALVFFASEIYFVKVDLSAKKLLDSKSIALEPGVINRGVITDTVKLKSYLQTLLDKDLVSIKKVIVIIPEDTVISKSLKLPDLPKSEVSEAISWEAEQYLPFALNSAVLDWKMLSQNGQNHILFQAASRDMIDSYINLFDSLKIEVLAIETPAMAMVRIAEQKPGIKLLIHVGKSVVVMTLAKDQEVITTSVVPITQDVGDKLQKTIEHMHGYYHDFPIDWIQIGGSGLNQNIINRIAALKIPVKGFLVPLVVDPSIASQFLLSISAALKPIEPPDDEKTINLLPKWYVSQKRRQSLISFLKKSLYFFTIFSLLLLLIMGGTYFWLNSQDKSLKIKQTQTSGTTKDAISQASRANSLAKQITALAPLDYYPLNTVEAIENLAKDKIKLAKLHLAMSEKKGELNGIASDRVSLLSFKQEVEELPQIETVYLPVSSFTEEENLPFVLRFSLTKDVLNYENHEASQSASSK